jgi:cation:H+ antiporter
MEEALEEHPMPLPRSIFWIVLGLVILVVSSRLLVWGAVNIAQSFGVSDLIIGLTIVAVGTSLPELASSLVAARKNEPDLALGNVIGSNMFNTLAVVGIAGTIHPLSMPSEILYRDIVMVAALTIALFVICVGFRGRQGIINRWEGSFLILAYAGYTGWLINDAMTGITG